MSIFRQFLIDNIKEESVIIPWELHTSITLEDVVYISVSKSEYILENTYDEHITIDDCEACRGMDFMYIKKHFDNMENVCLLYLILYESCHDMIFTSIDTNDISPTIFTEKFIEDAWVYARVNKLTHSLFSDTIKKLGYDASKEDYENAFRIIYLNK